MYSHVDSHTHSKAKNKTKQTKIIFKKKTNKKHWCPHQCISGLPQLEQTGNSASAPASKHQCNVKGVKACNGTESCW